jgi:mannose-6-phosphate isomerase-like protein (cupin superfamily)
VELDVGERLPLEQHPEERLLYFLYGRGIMSIYEESPMGDVYEIRQDTAVWMTPMIKHQILNTGNYPLKYIVLMTTGGLAPEGELSWSAISQRGVVVDKPQGGSGQSTTRVFDEGLNPSKEEGLHLTIRDIHLRRPQKFSNAEAVTISPGRSTRPHTHHDSEENYYILVGKGVFHWDDEEIPCESGSCISFPVGVTRRVENTGEYPLTYVCFSAFID